MPNVCLHRSGLLLVTPSCPLHVTGQLLSTGPRRAHTQTQIHNHTHAIHTQIHNHTQFTHTLTLKHSHMHSYSHSHTHTEGPFAFPSHPAGLCRTPRPSSHVFFSWCSASLCCRAAVGSPFMSKARARLPLPPQKILF